MTFKYLMIALAGTLAVALPSARAEISDAEFEKAMGAYLTKDANMDKLINALSQYSMKKRAESEKAEAQGEAQKLENQFKNPVKIDITGAPVRGKDSAKVTIVEFSDFQCPYCSRGKSVMEEVLKAYPNDVKVAFKHYPLPFHPQAKPAAKAAIAAQKQGKFWEMHDKLFENQSNLTEDAFLGYAKDLGLDIEKFKKDMADPATDKVIEENTALGQQNGVQGTPGFFVGGVQVSGARPFDYFKMLIDRWLKGGK